MLSSSEARIQISQCGYQSEPPVPSYFFSRDWIASEVAVHEDCDLVNMFLSSNSQRRFGLSHHRAARVNGTKSNSRGSLILWAKCFAVSARSNLSRAKYESLMQTDLYPVASFPFRFGLRLRSSTNLSCNFTRGVLILLGVRVAS